MTALRYDLLLWFAMLRGSVEAALRDVGIVLLLAGLWLAVAYFAEIAGRT